MTMSKVNLSLTVKWHGCAFGLRPVNLNIDPTLLQAKAPFRPRSEHGHTGLRHLKGLTSKGHQTCTPKHTGLKVIHIPRC